MDTMYYFQNRHKRNPIPVIINITNLITVYRIDWNSLKYNYPECHDFYEMTYVESGEFSDVINDKSISVKPGELTLYKPTTVHGRSDKSSSALIYIVSFETAEPIKYDIFNKPIKLSSKQRSAISDIFTEAMRLIPKRPLEPGLTGMHLEQENSLTLQKIKCCLEVLLIDLCVAESQKQASVTASNSYNASTDDFVNITEYLKKNINRSVSIQEVANEFSLSQSKLKRIFLQETSGGMIDYFNKLKISEAKKLIRNSKMNFNQISERLGFSSPQYFSRLFKAKTGLAPSEYARKVDKR